MALAAVAALCGSVLATAAAEPHRLLAGSIAGLCFAAPYIVVAATTAGRRESAKYAAVTQARPSHRGWMRRLALAMDQAKPKWVGLWARSGNGSWVTLWWVGSLIGGGGAAAAVSLAQWQPWPSVCAAVVGGHLAFVTALNGQPLLSPALRTSPVRYFMVWQALIRVPTLVSLAWFGIAILPAVVVSSRLGGESAAAAAVLVVLDMLFCAAVAINPSSRTRAALLHAILLATIVDQGLQYGTSFGALATVLVMALVAWLCRQARRRFRLNG